MRGNAGAAFTVNWSFNSRLQVTRIAADRTAQQPTVTLFASALAYGAASANNGNVTQQTISWPGKTFTQTYGYSDPANRLTSFAETGDTTARSQGYGYDAFGNGWQTSATGVEPLLATGPAWYQRGPTSQVTNRLKDVEYDEAGNQRYLNGTNTGAQLAYDGENRLISVTVSGTKTASYEYDGEGRRVKQTVGGATTSYIYGADGTLMAEYGPAGTESGTRLLVSDHLGSTRLITDTAGVCKARFDYAPFGAKIQRSVAGTPDCASESGVPMRFSGKERDAETGLDYFGARYMSSAQGRFTSPDTPLVDQNPEDPQSWNLYSYVRNNPLIFTDPTGNDCVYVNSGGNGIDSIDNQNTSKDCGKTGGYWVDGTVTDARFAHGSLILTGTTNGENRTSASYGLGPDPGLMALQEAGNRASRDVSTSAILIGGFATSYASTYAIPTVVAGFTAMGETGAVGPGVGLLNKINHIFGKVSHNLGGLVQQ